MTDEQFIEVCLNAESMRQACITLGLPFNTFKRKAIKLDCYKTNQGGKGKKVGNKETIEEYMAKHCVENGVYNTRSRIKIRLLEDGILEHKCDICGLEGEWNGKPIHMRLDHINGVNNDHRIENLRMICPNCDSQLDTFCGRWKGKK